MIDQTKRREMLERARVTGECQYFQGCRNLHTTTVQHPILGEVPACDKCAAFCDKVDKATEKS